MLMFFFVFVFFVFLFFFFGDGGDGTKEFEMNAVNKLKQIFIASPEEFENFKYHGLEIEQKNYCVYKFILINY